MLCMLRCRYKEAVDGFLEELVVRRELVRVLPAVPLHLPLGSICSGWLALP